MLLICQNNLYILDRSKRYVKKALHKNVNNPLAIVLDFFIYLGHKYFFIWLKCVIMKKLLTLGALVASVALLAGCMNKPATVDTTATGTDTTTTTTTPTPTVEQVAPATDTTTTGTDTTTTTTTPAPTAGTGTAE